MVSLITLTTSITLISLITDIIQKDNWINVLQMRIIAHRVSSDYDYHVSMELCMLRCWKVISLIFKSEFRRQLEVDHAKGAQWVSSSAEPHIRRWPGHSAEPFGFGVQGNVGIRLRRRQGSLCLPTKLWDFSMIFTY